MSEIIPREYCDETIQLKKTLESGFIALGERLSRISREQLWEGQWSNFGEFCREMDINEATASRLITVYETYVEQYKLTSEDLQGKSWYSLYQLRRVIPADANTTKVRELVTTTATLNRQEMNEFVHTQEKGECEHDWFEVKIRQCRNCNKREALA